MAAMAAPLQFALSVHVGLRQALTAPLDRNLPGHLQPQASLFMCALLAPDTTADGRAERFPLMTDSAPEAVFSRRTGIVRGQANPPFQACRFLQPPQTIR